jgi:hypothetical protein
VRLQAFFCQLQIAGSAVRKLEAFGPQQFAPDVRRAISTFFTSPVESNFFGAVARPVHFEATGRAQAQYIFSAIARLNQRQTVTIDQRREMSRIAFPIVSRRW